MVTGPHLCRLMRQHHIPIRTLAGRMGITLMRIRFVRLHGLTDPAVIRDWLEAITGVDPGPLLDA